MLRPPKLSLIDMLLTAPANQMRCLVCGCIILKPICIVINWEPTDMTKILVTDISDFKNASSL